MKINKPIFIIGCMRSGTTLLADLLGKHPNIIHCPFELKYVWSKIGKVPMASPRTLDRVCPQLKETNVRPGQRLQLARGFYREMLKNRAGKNINNAFFLNKNPHLCNKLPFVRALFPDARFIWIYRDMPSVAASLKKLLRHEKLVHYWPYKSDESMVRCFQMFSGRMPNNIDRSRCFPGGDVKYLAEYWYENNKAISDFAKTIAPEQMFTIKEEELINNPNKIISDCLDYLQLPRYLPTELINSIQPGRNHLWSKRLTNNDLQSLMNFVVETGDKLDGLFPEQNIFTAYKDQISS